jgi:Tfp pilus assembly protein PilN
VRPTGARLASAMSVEDFPHQPAGVWGTEYAAFLRKLGLRHAVATVILPRAVVIVRPLALPGVSNKDLDSAVRFQMDGLHPYSEDDVYSAWTRLPGTSTVVVAVARKDAVERYAAPFEEAGIRVGGFTCSAAAIYSALRLFGAKPAPELLAVDDSAEELEFYGESPTRPVFSASFEIGNERAASLAASELRIPSDTEPIPLSSLLGVEQALPFAAALSSACPHLSLALNLLPAERRQAGSRLRWAPSVAIGTAVLVLAGMLAAYPVYENRKYLKSLQTQIAAVAPRADRAGAIDKQVDVLQRRIQLLDDLRRHPRADMDVLAELTRILPPPTWLSLMQISPKQVSLGGETPEAAPLLSLLDSSRLFEGSEFQAAPLRLPGPGGETFRIKTNRRGVK